MAAKGPMSLRQHDCFLEEGRGGEPPRITWYGMMKPHLTSHTHDPSWLTYNVMVTAVDS
jgi:hypothetical protein